MGPARNRDAFALALKLAAAALLLLLPAQARADGVVFGDAGQINWQTLPETQQHAVIDWRDGHEKLTIAVALPADEKGRAVWLLPVPAPSGDVTADLRDSFRQYSGRPAAARGYGQLRAFMAYALLTQIHTVWHPVVRPVLERRRYKGSEAGFGAMSVERWGIRVEVLSVQSVPALRERLQADGCEVSVERLATLRPDLRAGHAVVCVWVAAPRKARSEFTHALMEGSANGARWPCVQVEFPTLRPFYPMRTTSAYGRQEVRALVQVNGYVQPDALPYHVWTRQYRVEPYREAALGTDRFTLVGYSGPAEVLCEDLTFHPGRTFSVRYAEAIHFILSRRWLAVPLWALFVAVISAASGAAAGRLSGWGWKPCARLGLWNLLTLAGLFVAVGVTHRSQRGLPFMLFFTVSFVVLATLLWWLLQMPLMD